MTLVAPMNQLRFRMKGMKGCAQRKFRLDIPAVVLPEGANLVLWHGHPLGQIVLKEALSNKLGLNLDALVFRLGNSPIR